MKKVTSFLMVLSLALFTIGCGTKPAGEPSAEELKKMESEMQTDMESMMGKIPQDLSKAQKEQGEAAGGEGAGGEEGSAAPKSP